MQTRTPGLKVAPPGSPKGRIPGHWTSDRPESAAMPVVEYGAAWLRAFVNRATGLRFEEAEAARVAAFAERKLVDLFNVAEEAALANGRSRILHHDLPLTKGLRSRLAEVEPLAGEIGAQPLLVFLADAGVAAPLDERVRADIPRLMAALVLLAGRVVALLDPDDLRPAERLERLRRRRGGPTRLDVERAARVVDLSL